MRQNGRMIVLGGDGYLGWPTAMHFARQGWTVHVVDNYARRLISDANNAGALFANPDLVARCAIFRRLTGVDIQPHIFDCVDYERLAGLVALVNPDVLVHFAEQPSAPFSMWDVASARYTLNNNLNTTFNVVWALLEHAPDCHLIKLGTMGEYGTPNIDIEEGWIDIHHRGRSDRFLFPRQGPSLYHTTKIMDTDLLYFYARTRGLIVTDLMQGPVYGIHTAETRLDSGLLTNFHYDDVFGTVLNRFVVQAIAGVPLTVYGSGKQLRGILNILDTLQCIEIAARDPPAAGELRVLNQITEVFSVIGLAERVAAAAASRGLGATIAYLPHPRAEAEEHYYNPVYRHFSDAGLVINEMTEDILQDMLALVARHADRIDRSRIQPRVFWRQDTGPHAVAPCRLPDAFDLRFTDPAHRTHRESPARPARGDVPAETGRLALPVALDAAE